VGAFMGWRCTWPLLLLLLVVRGLPVLLLLLLLPAAWRPPPAIPAARPQLQVVAERCQIPVRRHSHTHGIFLQRAAHHSRRKVAAVPKTSHRGARGTVGDGAPPATAPAAAATTP
jgi:hypothetical protein